MIHLAELLTRLSHTTDTTALYIVGEDVLQYNLFTRGHSPVIIHDGPTKHIHTPIVFIPYPFLVLIATYSSIIPRKLLRVLDHGK